MKKVYFFAVSLLATSTVFSQDSGDTLTFESFDLGSDYYFNGIEGTNGITFGNITLSNSFSAEEWGDNWDGFAVSKIQDITTSGSTNQYACFANGGANGSEKYGIYFAGYAPQSIEFSSAKILKSIQVTNTTFTAISMRDGDAFGKQFGSPDNSTGTPDGTNGEDWFLLQIIPLDENDALVGDTIDFYLADYRFADSNDDYIVNTWETINLNNVAAKKITFRLTSSDNGDFGMNTPSYFALDNLIADNSLSTNKLNTMDVSIYPNPTSGILNVQLNGNAELQVLNTMGQIVKTETVNGTSKIDISALPAGIYHINLKSEIGFYAQKVVVK